MNNLDWSALYCIQSLAAGVISGILGIYLIRHWKTPEAKPLVLLMFAVSEWALSYAAEYGSTGLESKLFWVRMEYAGSVWVSPLFLAFVLRSVGKCREFTHASLAVFLGIPTLTLAGVWTNEFHHFIWSAAWLDASDRFTLVAYARGPLFWLYLTFSYTLLLFATSLLFKAFLVARGVYRKQLGVILLGSLVPWLANVLYMSDLSPFFRVDFTPFAFMVSGLMLAYALSRYRLLDLRPVAREAVMENMADAVLVLDTQDRLVDLNAAAAERVVSGAKGDIIGLKAEDVLPDLYLLLARHRTGREMQVEIHLDSKADGGDYELRVSPLYHRRRHQAGWLVILRDISERKQAEAERSRLQARLQRARKMEAIGTLAGGVAHDLNNILSGIMTYPDLLLLQVPDDSPLHKPLETIRKTGEKAAAIVQDLLTLARRGVYAEEVILLNDVVSSYLNSPEHEKLLSFHSTVTVEAKLDPALLPIKGSRLHLHKTVMNLVSNAAEAMEEGGVISLCTESLYVDRPLRGYDDIHPGDYVRLTVSDTGVGISEEERDRLFEPFYTKKVMGRSGTGLGMSVVWGTVRDHNGYIDLESHAGEGTCFHLYFPASRESLPVELPAAASEIPSGKGESILIVDDVEEQREIARSILMQLGYGVAAVASGEDALKFMKRHTADLVVLDMIMEPGMDGLACYQKLTRLCPGQKAVIVSGFSESDRVRKAQELGAGSYLRKPYTLEALGSEVRNELDRVRTSPP